MSQTRAQSHVQNIQNIIENDRILRSIVRVLLMVSDVKYKFEGEVEAMAEDSDRMRRIRGYDDTEVSYLEEYTDRLRAHLTDLDEAVEEATRLMIRYLSRVIGKPVIHSYSVNDEKDIVTWKYAEIDDWCIDFDYIDKDGRVHELTSICLD